MENKFLYDIFNAYYDARRNKKNTKSQLEFELNYESNLLKLYEDLLGGTYKIGSSTCFLICDTVPREIFAADFRDRIVHHRKNYNKKKELCSIVSMRYNTQSGYTKCRRKKDLFL